MFDFEEQFAKFVNNGQDPAIRDIYDIIPSFLVLQLILMIKSKGRR